MSLTEYDEEEAKKVFHDDGYNEGRAEGMAQGMAAQKAEDEKIIQEKDAEIVQKDAEITRLKAFLEGK